MLRNIKEKNKGITLIALVVTIIVLLLLAGITISTLMGENGIITNSQNAKSQSMYAEAKEKMDLTYMAVRTEIATKKAKNGAYDAIDDIDNLLSLVEKELNSEKDEKWDVEKSANKIIITYKNTQIDQNSINVGTPRYEGYVNGEIILQKQSAKFNFDTQDSTDVPDVPDEDVEFNLSKGTLSVIKEGTGLLSVDTELEISDSDVIWETSDSSIVTVNNGTLSAIDTGVATITCKLKEDKSIKDECTVTVVDGSLITLESEAGEVLDTHLRAKNFPTDCTIEFKFATNLAFDPTNADLMQRLRDSVTYTPETYPDIVALKGDYYELATAFYWDYFYRLKDSFGNYSDYFWVSPNFLCFTENTKVQTQNGYIDIEDVKIGDKVYSMNLETFTMEEKEVLKTFKNETENSICKIYTSDTDYVECTFGHEIYTTNKGWTKAYYLETGDKLLDSNNNEVTVVKNEKLKNSGTITVYNFEVDGNHNYFVGNHNILVHNPPEPLSCKLEDGHVYTSTNIGK